MATSQAASCRTARRLPPWVKYLAVIVLLYLFLVAVGLMGHVFKSMAKNPEVFDVKAFLIKSTDNPVLGLFIGIFVTAVAQSSSFTTSMVVTLVASGTMTVSCAIPIVMGSNIGTTVTNTLVSMGHITRKDEFKRAFAGATLHDFFNLMAVLALLPLELITAYFMDGRGLLQRIAEAIASLIKDLPGFEKTSPLKAIVNPVVDRVWDAMMWVRGVTGVSDGLYYGLAAAASLLLIFFVLYYMVKTMRAAFIGRVEHALNSAIFKRPMTAMASGAACTAVVQSSSITTSLMVPLVGGGIVKLERVFPFILGANLGTTFTALLAALVVATPECLTVALVHLLFNVLGIALIYPVRRIRALPIRLARWFGERAATNRYVCPTYVVGVFFVLPWILIWIMERW
jgi:sodium-dependent phosphate cotransporter